ncbi:TPA: hypothetical protein ACTNWX_002713 [Legionella pneumophila]|nr:hypothetical protein [Legionella pneumophila subsp. pneumophila]
MQIVHKLNNELTQKIPNKIRSILILTTVLIFITFFILYFSFPFYTIVCEKKQPRVAQYCSIYNPIFNFFGVKQDFKQIEEALITSKMHVSTGRYTSTGLHYTLSIRSPSGLENIAEIQSTNIESIRHSKDSINQYLEYSSDKNFIIPYNAFDGLGLFWASVLALLVLIVCFM